MPVGVAGLAPFLMTGWRQENRLPELLRFLGAIALLAGLISLVESMVQFVVRGRGTPAPIAPPTKLVVSGQYRYLRNPMYIAVVSIVLGQAAWLGSVALLAYAAVLFVLFHIWVVRYEEPTLARQFGASFEEYRRHVRRWWPRIRAWRSE